MTFSIVARTPDASLFGVAIASSSPAVAARCAHARAGVGAVATQNITNPALGPAALAQLERTGSSSGSLDHVLGADTHRDYRQLLGIGRSGPAAIRSGAHVLGIHGEALGEHAAAAGNLLARPSVPAAMIQAFEQAGGHLGARLLMALQAAREEGGEAGPVHSAGLLIVRDVPWPIVDLRVDWTESDPIAALSSIWQVYAPQIEDYVRRARDPTAAPSFNVAGDRLRNHRNDV
jgi:uncharacterized Ntn-hydrolase superfamily protein